VFYTQVAQHILSCHAQELPDLRGVTIVLPNYHVAQPLAQALIARAEVAALLLPQMVTLSDWAQRDEADEPPIQPDTQRIATLYQALRERKWFGDADLWSLSREMLGLMDELTRHHVALPTSAEEFSAQLVAAYQARNGAALQFEARVVHELWFAMAATGDLDSVRAYQQRLAKLAQRVAQPLYVLQTSALAKPEAAFFAACRARVAVTVFDLRDMATAAPNCELLATALQRETARADLRSDAQRLSAQTEAVLTNRLQLFAAQGLEHEARAAEVQVRRWLLDGNKSIAVVVQDRLVARRVRALLERAQVQVQDETGWTFATLSVSTVLMRWLDALQNDFYYQDVLDLFKSPFLFADVPAGERKQAAYLFEQLVRKHGAITQLENFIELAQQHCTELTQPLVRLRQASLALPKKHATLVEWLRAARASLDVLGVISGWARDAAGQQLLQLFAQWLTELQHDDTRCSFAEWRRWLSQQLDLNTFRDTAIDSPVIFTHLPATRWRSFEAVLVVGCDAQHLPAPTNAGLWFNDAVRAALGLPLSNAQALQVRDDLLGLLAINRTVLMTWQASKAGEPNLLSPYLELVRALHLLAYQQDLAATELADLLDDATVRNADFALPSTGEMPKPSVAAIMLPSAISPSGYNSLVACPYQFYARHILRLNELDEVREALDKRDYGTWVHAALQRFHSEFPVASASARAVLDAALARISREVFADALAHDYLAQAWLLRWQTQIPAYLDWQLSREAEGWRHHSAELPFSVDVLDGLTLRGRIDRVDYQDEGEQCAVLDYKTQTVSVLKSKLKDAGEDVQLACYALTQNATDAEFVSLDGDKICSVVPPQDVADLAQLNFARLQKVFEQLRQQTPMPAHSSDAVCAYCEMKGLCRRGEWETIGKSEVING